MSQNDITPALSPEQWPGYLLAISPDIRARGNANHFTMAIANAALPDDDPRKITRADVELLQALDLRMLSGGRIPALAAKLAALLPPE